MARCTFVIGLFIFTLLSVANTDGQSSFCSPQSDVERLIGGSGILDLNAFSCRDDNFLIAKYGNSIVSAIEKTDDGEELNKLRCICYEDLMKDNAISQSLRPSEEDKKRIRREKIADLVERSIENLAQQVMPQIDLSPASAREVASVC